jgi:hypothetical protein
MYEVYAECCARQRVYPFTVLHLQVIEDPEYENGG